MEFPVTVVLILILYALTSIKILSEYERAVVFRLIDRMVRISLRLESLEVPPQDVVTKDNVTVKVNAVIFFRVMQPQRAVLEVTNFLYTTSLLAQTTLRSVL